MKKIATIILPSMFLLFAGCNHSEEKQSAAMIPNPLPAKDIEKRTFSEDFKSYWYSGTAELTSYTLKQARYGELHEGHAVLVYVTEPFLKEKQVKANRPADKNISVLKLNKTKKFLTGIYPYSIMTSSFYPVYEKGQAIKVANSVQEWCGQVFNQLNNRESFEIQSFSYFESEGDRNFSLDKNILEDEIWNKIRIAPEELPIGEHMVIPSFEYSRLKHRDFRAYRSLLSKKEIGNNTLYTLEFPELKRTLKITFASQFPHTIESWTETTPAGFGGGEKMITTTATLNKRIQAPYWGQHDPKDIVLREKLGL
ncbi:MAG: septum formation inhibitor Maf [Bacteroidia bacterium]|nr:septum formation inhibitor Maf [Bacteroidia bacterium]